MSAKDSQENSIELCPAGKMLEGKLAQCTDNLLEATKAIQSGCADVAESCKDLRDFAIRDKEKIASLEESRVCKNKKIEALRENAKKHEVALAAHLGEHDAIQKLEGSAGKKWGLSGAFGGIGIVEALRFIFR